ncbi:hypothetical protein EI94DRAFT_1749030 [Lactarius quietus]|nr:hypothetical protein EI94DRAFT_1749030 [Lactarius quietus]
MTNISNYGPVRRMSPPVSADNRKPYSRTGLKGVLGTLDLNSGDSVVPTTLDSPYYPFHVETPQLEAPTQGRFTVPDGSRDIAGFPTYEQYQRIEEEYLSSLSERKQPKALISQNRASTAQFRFWVRKMFVLAYPQTSFNHNTTTTTQSPEPVVLHDKRPVAIKERLYEVLCYCHAIARHGGRDKTCAMLRLHYSWVPKELTAKFVNGNPDLLSQINYSAPPYVPAAPDSTLLSTGGPNDSSSFAGSSVSDNGSATGSSAASFAPSIFATPDLSVYPSPTLSTGSGGPMTPSPYLHGGLFGYPAVFDPGHSSLSSVASWDPSPSPCVPAYRGGGIVTSRNRAAAPATTTTRMQGTCTSPRPGTYPALRAATTTPAAYSASAARAIPSRAARPPPPPCVIDGNIDPALFMEGFPTPGPARLSEAQWEMPAGAFGVQSLHLLLHLAAPNGVCCAGMVFAPVPVGVGRLRSVLCEMQEMDADADAEIEADGRPEVKVEDTGRGEERWESPEAWLVPSDSAEEADGVGKAEASYHE